MKTYPIGSIVKDEYFNEFLYGVILPWNVFKSPRFENGIVLTSFDSLDEITNIFI